MALVRLSVADAAGRTELRRGDTVELRLPECRATGYRWRWLFPEALRMVADEPVADGGHTLTFDVTACGLHEVRAELARPWEGRAKQALTFVLDAS